MLFRRGPERLKSVRLDFSSIFMYSLSAFVASIAMVGFANTPNIILNVLVGSAVTGLFAVSLTITSPIFTIPSVLNSALFPIMSSLSANKGGRVSQKILINMVLRYAFLITLPIIAILMIFSDTIILFFSSGDFLPAKQFLPIVGIGGFIFGIGGILNSSIYAIRKPVISRNITLLTFIIFLSLSIPLSILFSGMGMAIAYLISVFVFCSASAVYLKKFIGLSIDWISIAKVLAVVVVFASILFGINFVASSTLLKVVGVLLASLIYFILLIPLKFYKKEDLRILGFLSDKSPIGRGIFDRIKITLSRFV
jgi:O-antigen/teichoic acid export membrane protein